MIHISKNKLMNYINSQMVDISNRNDETPSEYYDGLFDALDDLLCCIHRGDFDDYK